SNTVYKKYVISMTKEKLSVVLREKKAKFIGDVEKKSERNGIRIVIKIRCYYNSREKLSEKGVRYSLF
ncbi:hypothetical protein P6U32_34075, partial [Bacillus paranthracis]|nr:hypothetical protein [Bacillus paranthracis]